jgi:hypothetical protein
VDLIMTLQFKVIHGRGTENTIADGLSCQYDVEINALSTEKDDPNNIHRDLSSPPIRNSSDSIDYSE